MDSLISIHVPAWGTTGWKIPWCGGLHISIHVPAWGTTARKRKDNTLYQFQSTFPRGERRRFRPSVLILSAISIHVPAWGTTQSVTVSFRTSCYFNPRSRVGNDADENRHSSFRHGISIHVPAWGTTSES